MAFPTVESVTESSFVGDTPHSVSLPATVTDGDLLLLYHSRHPPREIDTPSGWTELFDFTGLPIGAALFAKLGASGDSGGSVTINRSTGTNSLEGGSAQVHRITGWEGTVDASGTSVAVATASSQNSNPDPPSLNPSFTGDILWIAGAQSADDDATVTATPTNYGNLVETLAGAGANSSAATATTRRELNASSDDPAAYTLSESEAWLASTVAVRPGTSGGGGGTTQNVTATLAGTSTDSVGSIILNLTGTTTLAGTSTTGGAITTTDLVALTATLAGTSTDTAAVSLKEAITATLAGMSVDGGAVSIKDVVALAATLAGTSEDSGVIDLGPLVPGTYTTYDAVGIREDLQGKARGRSMSKRALETAEQQLNDLLNNR